MDKLSLYCFGRHSISILKRPILLKLELILFRISELISFEIKMRGNNVKLKLLELLPIHVNELINLSIETFKVSY